MSHEQPKTRSIVSEIEINATIEAVWKALTEAEEITRWFSEEARVTPGVGGSFWVSWGGQAGESRVEVWEPGRRLLLRNLPPEANEACAGEQYDDKTAAETRMIQEYTLETRGGRTVLRLVDSGIPDSPEWEGMYDGKTRGWEMFFHALRHYLESATVVYFLYRRSNPPCRTSACDLAPDRRPLHTSLSPSSQRRTALLR